MYIKIAEQLLYQQIKEQMKYAEYFTDRLQRNEYIYELVKFINSYIKNNHIQKNELYDKLLKLLNNKQKFTEFINKLKEEYQISGLVFIYHMLYNKAKKTEVIKLLENILK